MTKEATRDRRFGGNVRHIAVIGGSSAPPGVLREAERVGRELALAGAAVICGGLGGVMEAACRGAANAGGFTIGILPGEERREANRWVQCAIPTGLGHFRNFLVVRAADGVVALPGASGTLSEAAMARTLGKPVVAVSPDAGEWSVPGAMAAPSAAEAVRLILANTETSHPSGGGAE
jgi:hypothetical protein